MLVFVLVLINGYIYALKVVHVIVQYLLVLLLKCALLPILLIFGLIGINLRWKGVCSRCGQNPVFARRYWRDGLPEDTPVRDWKLVCTKCWRLLKEEGYVLMLDIEE